MASLERLGEILGGARAGDIRRGSEAARPRRAARTARRRGRRRRPPSDGRCASPIDPIRSEAASDEGTARHVRRLARRRRRPSAAPSWCARSGRRHGPRAPSCCTPTTAGWPARSAAAAWRAPRPRRSSARARPGHARVIRYGISDEQAWDVGLACGGTIDVLVEPALPAPVVAAARASLGAGGHGSAVITPLPADSPPGAFGRTSPATGRRRPGAHRARRRAPRAARSARPTSTQQLVDAAARRSGAGSSRTVELGGRSLLHRGVPGPAAAGHRGRRRGGPLAGRGSPRELGFETVVIDGRAAFATPERFPDVDRLIVGWPDEVADEIGLGPNDAVAVLTHDVKFDEPAIVEALRRGCRYVGAVGSRKTQADRRARLLEAGVTEAELAPAARPDRARPRRSRAGRDRARDPRRDRRGAVRRQRRSHSSSARSPDPRGSRSYRRARPGGRGVGRGSAAASSWRRSAAGRSSSTSWID